MKASRTGRSFRTLRLEAERRSTLHRVTENVAGAHVHQAWAVLLARPTLRVSGVKIVRCMPTYAHLGNQRRVRESEQYLMFSSVTWNNKCFFLVEQTMNYFSWDVTWVTYASRFVRVIRVCLSSQYVINIGDEERKCWQPFANVPANEEATNTCPTLTECFSKGLSMEKVQNDV